LAQQSDDNSPVFVSTQAATAVFDWRPAIAALQSAYSQPEEPNATPPRTIGASGKAWIRSLPAAPPGGRYLGAKLMSMSMEAADPACQYVIVLFDRHTSRLVGFVDGEKVTGFRTAATTAAALDKMAPTGPARIAILGSGFEASVHARAFAAIREISELAVFSPTQARCEAFAQAMKDELGIATRAATSPEDAVRGAGVVLAAARSRGEKPILFADWLEPGALSLSIGSVVPSQREVDVSMVERSELIVCDMVHEVIHETGDMIAAAQAGIEVSAKCFSLNALMRGELSSRLADARLAMFKSVGGGLQDVVVAGMILDRARQAGLVTALPISFT
jgi:ornithine cyclodeaminase/alanine dehydrogenase